jgi:hypothetical protein
MEKEQLLKEMKQEMLLEIKNALNNMAQHRNQCLT